MALLQEACASVGDFPNGRVLVGGEEAELLWQATVDAFSHGLWVATILCAHATCERTLAAIVSLRELPGWGVTTPKGWERWGLETIIKYVREHGWVPDDVLDDVDVLCEARKPYGHWRQPFDAGTAGRQVGEALKANGWQSDPVEVRQRILSLEALRAARTTIRLYWGNYGFSGLDGLGG